MTNEGSSSTLVLVAAILQLIFMFVFAGFTGLVFFALSLIPTIPPMYLPPEVTLAELLFGSRILVIGLGAVTVLALLFSILWFMWWKSARQHKTALIITGIAALILAGILPGLLAMIGGVVTPSEAGPVYIATSEAPATKPSISPAEEVRFCAHCGNMLANPNALYCGVCGASLT